MLEIIKFDSFKKGKNLLVLGAIHGDEICGPKAIINVIEDIKNNRINIKSGSVTFIPICNPEAYRQNKRFIDVNLNRTFKTIASPVKYEEVISQKIMKYIDDCDYLLDIHSMPTDGLKFAFLDVNKSSVKEFVKIQNFQHIMIGWNELFNEEDNSTCGYGFKKNKICTTIECGNHNNPESVSVAKMSILNSLAFLNISDCQLTIDKTLPKYIKMEKIFYKTKKGEMTKNWEHLDKVRKGEIIAKYDDGEFIKSDEDCLMIMPHRNPVIGNDWFYLGKFQ